MTEKYIHKLILILTVLAIVGFGSSALAHMGQGDGYNRGGHHQGYGGFGENLSEAEIKQMQAEHKAFFEATREIRQQIYQKRLELGSELAKKDTDPEKAIGLQKEISELKSQMGLKRLDHILKLKKINPDVGRGLMGHGPMGHGMMGSQGYGGCPNSPGPGFGRGYGMGAGMMGPGYHMGSGMGPGGSGRDDTRQYHGMQSSPTE
jgi:hypothetical protein